jgi:subtilisin family serine protease
VRAQRAVLVVSLALAAGSVASASAHTDTSGRLDGLRESLTRAHLASGETAKLDHRLANLAALGSTTRVVLEGRSVAGMRAAVARAGGRVEASAAGLVQAKVPSHALLRLSRDTAVGRVRPPATPVPLGITGEGVVSTNASAWHAAGLTGSGTKIAVIDTGFGGLAAKQAAGELPTSAVPVDYCGGRLNAGVHGTAVAEIVADEAPGAQLYLICMDSEVTLAQAETYAKNAGVDVITMSVGFFNTWRGDGRGPQGTPDAVVADARAAGILWINAAGNDALNHWGGTYNDPAGAGFHSFSPSGDVTNTVRVPGGVVMCVFLRWDDWPNAREDYDLGLYDENTRRFVARSVGDQRNLHDPPVEQACYTTNGARTIGVMISGPASSARTPAIDLFIEGLPASVPVEHRTAERSVADPAASENALGVGAICWQSSGLEPFSSQGPTIDGRGKPDLVAPDAVSSSVFGPFFFCGLSGFIGTSAAAPHVAGAAALVKQAFPSFKAAQLQDYLLRHAEDLGAPGRDNLYGAGRLLMPPPDLAPTVRALAARAKRGTSAELRFRVADDGGEAREQVAVYRGAAVLRTIAVPFAAAPPAGEVHSVRWRIPLKRAAYRFCVIATDRRGNVSDRSCAPIRAD